MRKVLIIDQDYEFREMVKDFLRSNNFEVIEAKEGKEGLEKVAKFKPDLVLLSRELKMLGTEKEDGLAILKMLKSHPQWRKIPVILLSEDGSEKNFEKLRRKRYVADDYAPKPIEDTELLRRIENLIGFDPEEQRRELLEKLDELEEEKISRLFEADKQELGTSFSESARRELLQILKQVGQDIGPSSPVLEVKLSKVDEDSDRVKELKEKLEALEKSYFEERAKFSAQREKWKKALIALDERLKDNQRREQELRDELEEMRKWTASLEIEYTRERDILKSENLLLRERLEKAEEYSRKVTDVVEELKKAFLMIKKVINVLEEQEEN